MPEEEIPPKEKPPKNISPDEMAAAFAGPAPFVNKTVLTLAPTSGRLAFLEVEPGGVAHFRAAISLSTNDLINLRDLLNRMTQDAQVVDLRKLGGDRDA